MFRNFWRWLTSTGHWSHKIYDCERCGGPVEQRGRKLCYLCDCQMFIEVRAKVD